MTRQDALKIRAVVEVASALLPDKDASKAPTLFPRLKKDGSLVKAGTRINWQGKLKRAAVDLWDTAENNPENAPTLWEDIEYVNGIRKIPETITATLAFALDELGVWTDGKVYKSLMDGNVYTPEQAPTVWEVQEA